MFGWLFETLQFSVEYAFVCKIGWEESECPSIDFVVRVVSLSFGKGQVPSMRDSHQGPLTFVALLCGTLSNHRVTTYMWLGLSINNFSSSSHIVLIQGSWRRESYTVVQHSAHSSLYRSFALTGVAIDTRIHLLQSFFTYLIWTMPSILRSWRCKICFGVR